MLEIPWGMLRALAAGGLIASTLAVSLRLTHLWPPALGIPSRWAAIVCTGMWVSTVGFHALLALHAFHLWGALFACGGLMWIACNVAPQRAPLRRVIRRELRALRAIAALFARTRRGFWFVLGAALSIAALRALIIPPLGWDTLTYHGPRAAQWVQSGKFTFDDGVGPYNYYRHFFSGGEVLMAWAMLAFGVVLWLFYTFYVPAIWFFTRYLAPVHACLSVLLGLFVARFAAERGNQAEGRRAYVALSCLIFLTGWHSARYLYVEPPGSLDRGNRGAKGYRQAAHEMLRRLPAGAVVGALQSGALGYYALDSATRVVNLDGVVDHDAALAFRDHCVAAFAAARGVTHLCDWELNIQAMLARSGDSRWTRNTLHLIGHASPQGVDRFALYALPPASVK